MKRLIVLYCLLMIRPCLFQTTESTTAKSSVTTPDPIEKGLHCYSCYGIGPNNACENYTSYELAWKHHESQQQTGKVHLKPCAWPYNVTCIINTYVSNTGEKAHIRDCSDDKTFGFPKDKKERYSVLKYMASNNETKCAWDGAEMICLTKCNSTNFCNGPTLAATNSHLSLVLLFASVFAHLCCSDL